MALTSTRCAAVLALLLLALGAAEAAVVVNSVRQESTFPPIAVSHNGYITKTVLITQHSNTRLDDVNCHTAVAASDGSVSTGVVLSGSSIEAAGGLATCRWVKVTTTAAETVIVKMDVLLSNLASAPTASG